MLAGAKPKAVSATTLGGRSCSWLTPFHAQSVPPHFVRGLLAKCVYRTVPTRACVCADARRVESIYVFFDPGHIVVHPVLQEGPAARADATVRCEQVVFGLDKGFGLTHG